ncbi:hypothetical protein ESCOMMO078B1_21945 [Escherichia coli]
MLFQRLTWSITSSMDRCRLMPLPYSGTRSRTLPMMSTIGALRVLPSRSQYAISSAASACVVTPAPPTSWIYLYERCHSPRGDSGCPITSGIISAISAEMVFPHQPEVWLNPVPIWPLEPYTSTIATSISVTWWIWSPHGPSGNGTRAVISSIFSITGILVLFIMIILLS